MKSTDHITVVALSNDIKSRTLKREDLRKRVVSCLDAADVMTAGGEGKRDSVVSADADGGGAYSSRGSIKNRTQLHEATF